MATFRSDPPTKREPTPRRVRAPELDELERLESRMGPGVVRHHRLRPEKPKRRYEERTGRTKVRHRRGKVLFHFVRDRWLVDNPPDPKETKRRDPRIRVALPPGKPKHGVYEVFYLPRGSWQKRHRIGACLNPRVWVRVSARALHDEIVRRHASRVDRRIMDSRLVIVFRSTGKVVFDRRYGF